MHGVLVGIQQTVSPDENMVLKMQSYVNWSQSSWFLTGKSENVKIFLSLFFNHPDHKCFNREDSTESCPRPRTGDPENAPSEMIENHKF